MPAQLPRRVRGELAELRHRRPVEPTGPPETARQVVVGTDAVEGLANRDRVMDPHRQREVVESEHHTQTPVPGAVQDACIAADCGSVRELVELSQLALRHAVPGTHRCRRVRKDPAPLDSQPDRVVVKAVAGEIEVGRPAAPEARAALDAVAAHDAVLDQLSVMREDPPVAPPVRVRGLAARLDLEPGTRGPPQETLREPVGGLCGGGQRERGEN